MKMITGIFILLIMYCMFSNVSTADEDGVMERFGRLEVGQDAINKRIDDVRSEINGVRSEINGVRSEINGVRSEINSVRSEINGVRSELKSDLKDSKTDIMQFMLWGFGVTFAGIFALMGFVLWDRRTAIAPVISKNRELEDKERVIEKALNEMAAKERMIEDALKEMATKESFVEEALKHAGFL